MPSDEIASTANELPVELVSTVEPAQFIYYDGVTTYGQVNNIVHISLYAGHLISTGTGPSDMKAQNVTVALLRGNMQAAIALRDALDKAIKGNAPPKGQAN